MLILGILAAAGASALYSLGIALQAMDAKEAPGEDHLRPALVIGPVPAYPLAVRHRTVDAGVAAAGAGAAAGAARGGAADARRRPARAAVLRRADAGRARGPLRAPGDARDRARHGRNAGCSRPRAARARRQAADDHARAARARAAVHAAVSAARVGAFDRRGDDGLRRSRRRLERDRDEARLERSLTPPSGDRAPCGVCRPPPRAVSACSAR